MVSMPHVILNQTNENVEVFFEHLGKYLNVLSTKNNIENIYKLQFFPFLMTNILCPYIQSHRPCM